MKRDRAAYDTTTAEQRMANQTVKMDRTAENYFIMSKAFILREQKIV